MGVYAAIIGVTISLVTVFVDGVAAKQLAAQWAAAPEAEKVVALSAVSTNETINFALAGLFNLSFAGVPFLLLGLAVAISGAYPRWLGWVAAFAGLGSIAAGLVQAFTGEPTTASLVLTIIGPTVISMWLLVMGVLVGAPSCPGALGAAKDRRGARRKAVNSRLLSRTPEARRRAGCASRCRSASDRYRSPRSLSATLSSGGPPRSARHR